MKKLLFLILLSATAVSSKAQDGGYKPMLTDGKMWVFNHENIIYGDRIYTETVCGDTVVNGLTCKKIHHKYIEPYYKNISEYYYALYEDVDNGKVYEVNNNYEQPLRLRYDFNLPIGSNVPVDPYSIEPTDNYAYKLQVIDSISVKGRTYKRLTFRLGDADWGDEYYWVEGIGSNSYFFTMYPYPLPTDGTTGNNMLRCYDGDELIFEAKDFKAEAISTGISTVTSTDKAATGKTYDLGGRAISKPRTGDVYIKDGKKYINR